jgi:hypothetical protein
MITNETYQDSILIRRVTIDPAAATVTTYELVDGELTQTDSRAMTADEVLACYTSEQPDPTEALKAAARLAVDAQVRAETLDDDTVAALAPLYDPWLPWISVVAGELRSWDGTVVECIQPHTTQPDWTPDVTPALWKVHRTTTGDTPDEWVQPTCDQDVYHTGDLVAFEGSVYESLIDNNVWSPADYPAGWRRVS